MVTDTAGYSDLVFGLFAICGYQFSPRLADLADTRLWRTNTAVSYGPLKHMSRHTSGSIASALIGATRGADSIENSYVVQAHRSRHETQNTATTWAQIVSQIWSPK